MFRTTTILSAECGLQVQNIIEKTITPDYKKGDFDEGTLSGMKAIVVAIESEQFLSVNALNHHNDDNAWKSTLTAVIVFVGLISGSIYVVITMLIGMGFTNDNSCLGSSGTSRGSRRIRGSSSGSSYFCSGSDFGGGSSDGGGAGGDF